MKTIYNAVLNRLNEINIPYINNWYDRLIENVKKTGLPEDEKELTIDGLNETRREKLAKASLYWFDWDKGQLKKKDATGRYAVAFPCGLIRIGIKETTDITDTIQDCKSAITITLAFDTLGLARTAANAPEDVREKGLEPYDVIADVYSLLQGFETDNFNPLSRISQGEVTHNDLFVYQIVFSCHFEDNTAEN